MTHLQIEYYTNVFFNQGATFSEGLSFASAEEAADDINESCHDYVETIRRRKDGTCERLDLSGEAAALASYDRAEADSYAQHDGLSRQVRWA